VYDELYFCTAGSTAINLITGKSLAHLCRQFWCSQTEEVCKEMGSAVE